MVISCVLCTLFAILCPPPETQTPEPALEVLEAEKGLKLDRLWPGFEPLETAVALYDGQKTVLARHPDPPEEFKPWAGHDGFYCCDGRYPQVTANSTSVINGRRTATLMLNMNPDPDPEASAAIAVHESFHVFQWTHHPDWLANEAVTFTYPIEDVSGLAYRRLEAQWLNKAVSSDDVQEARAWVMGALALRKERFARLTEDQRAYDRNSELIEGTAHYVENRSLGKTSVQLSDEIRADDVRKRNYATGQALCVLLDRFGPEWKQSLEEGPKQDLDTLLDEALKKQNICGKKKVSPHLPDQAIVAEMERKAAKDIQKITAARQVVRDAFMNAEGWTLVIEVDHPDRLFWPAGFDPMNVVRLGDKEVLHTRMLKLSGQAGSFEAMDRKTLTLAKGPHPLYNGIVRITVTGLPEAPKIEETGDRLLISTQNIKVNLQNATLDKEEKKILVRL